MIKVYVPWMPCPQCKQLEELLVSRDLPYEKIVIDQEMTNLKEATAAIGIDATSIRSAPVMIVGTNLWTGYDCIVAIENDEHKQ